MEIKHPTNNYGGKRLGAGRPCSEPTATVRVPVCLKPAILGVVADYKRSSSLPPGALRPLENAPRRPIPLFTDRVAAGFPSPATDYVETRLDLNELVIQHFESTFFLRAKGLSMIGAGIHDSDVLVVDRSLTPSHGNVVIAVVDGEFTVKRLHRQGGKVKLVAENPDFPDITFKDGQELTIWGVVTNVVHKL